MVIARNKQELFVAIVSGDRSFANTIASALRHLGRDERQITGMSFDDPSSDFEHPVFRTLSERANTYLDEALPDALIKLVNVARLDELDIALKERLRTLQRTTDGPRPWSDGTTVLFLIDTRTASTSPNSDARFNIAKATLFRVCEKFGISLSPYSVCIYDEFDESIVYSHTFGSRRKLPDEKWVLAVDAIRAFTDLVQTRHANARAILPETETKISLSIALTDFLTRQAGTRWGFHFFTGTIVSKLIQDCATAARWAGNPVLRGANEHSLAAGALARWQLQQAPFLIVVTAAMVDEFRGTLANLRAAQAKGFIVFGETEPGVWQPFQGTVHRDEDARAVMAARGIPCVYLTDPDRLGQDLTAAFEAYHRRQGPVAIIASPTILRYAEPIEIPKPEPVAAQPNASDDSIDAVARLLNEEPCVVVCQCGHLSESERNLVYEIAHQTGIALVDSLARPGTTARYDNGRVVDEFLGTMSLYGCSSSVWHLLHPAGRPLEHDENAVIFLKSRITDLATPFSESVLRDRIRVVQVTDTPSHIAPFTDLPVVDELHSFLVRLKPRIAPKYWIVERRRTAIAEARARPLDPLVAVPSMPMSSEYFFAQLNAVLEELIANHNYTYTGFYDVGRGGISAVRNLVRTGEGVSGWYGRALMGDALEAIPAVALSSRRNILGFIGDGALQLVPSILPALRQQLCYEGARIEGNVSIFHLLNGGFSIIRSYRELQQSANTDAQMSLLTSVEGDWQTQYGETEIAHQRLVDLNPAALSAKLLAPATLNLFSVYLAHDNEGDSVLPLSRKNWRM
ncbi:hypothetical protein FAZ69_01890 [Trinickia terrae]|uniref:Thiamine pyrophosphate-binding protein n=1 Tax=Trinickia terrae TaxID=2571161 RepID=A0A4U1IFK6_9BURK|nr:hypothetical protein [Trinickia terrae]TKC92451.1 hypothetical protein FAZ69_01890 [Trinickia terrae]